MRIRKQDPALRKRVKVRCFTLRVPLHHTNPVIKVVDNYKNHIRLLQIPRGHLYECDAAGNNREKGSIDHFRVFFRGKTSGKGSAVLLTLLPEISVQRAAPIRYFAKRMQMGEGTLTTEPRW